MLDKEDGYYKEQKEFNVKDYQDYYNNTAILPDDEETIIIIEDDEEDSKQKDQ